MEELLREIKLLRRDVNGLHERIEKMEKHTNRMNRHISFVEHLYSRFEYPLEFIRSKVSSLKNIYSIR